MSTSLRNFLITFGIFLVVFGLVGWLVIYPLIIENIPGGDESITEVSEEISNTTSGTISTDIIVEGDTFTAVVVGKSSDGQIASIIFFRSNEITKHFTYSFIPIDMKMINSVGVDVPLKTLLVDLNGEEIAQRISAVTGMRVDYYAILGTDELSDVVNKMTSPYIDIAADIKYINPELAGEAALYENPTEIPQEFYINIGQGRKDLNAELIKQLLDFDAENEYKAQTRYIYEAVFTQFFTNPGTKNDSVPYALLNDITNTNINTSVLEENLDIIFTFDSYLTTRVDYPTKSMASSTYDWDKAIKKFKEADGQE